MKVTQSRSVILTILISLSIFFVTACNPFPPYCPFYPGKLYEVKDDVYTAPIGQGGVDSMQMMVYPATADYEAIFMGSQEIFGRHYTYVSFGPVASDKTMWRILVADKCHMGMAFFKHKYLPMIIDYGARGFDRQMSFVYQRPITLNGFPGSFEVYTQTIPGPYMYYSREQPGDITLTHVFYIVDYGRYGVIIWIQANSDSGVNGVDRWNRYQLINNRWKPQMRFLRSFWIHPSHLF